MGILCWLSNSIQHLRKCNLADDVIEMMIWGKILLLYEILLDAAMGFGKSCPQF